MMLEAYIGALSATKAVAEVLKSGAELYHVYLEKFRDSEEVKDEAARAMVALENTYSDSEVKALETSISRCMDNFAKARDPEGRVECLCHILQIASAGNGGVLPDIGNWRDLYDQLKCSSRHRND